MTTSARTRRTGTASVLLAATLVTMLTGCRGPVENKAAPAASGPGGVGQAGDRPADVSAEPVVESTKTGTRTTKPTTAPPTKPAWHGPTISFKVAQKPKCPEGTAVFRAEAVPLIIKWEITGADSALLSVDDPTNTPGTYGPVDLKGSEEFRFSCGGEVGSTETHTYAIYTVGGGDQKHKKLSVSAKVLDQGKATP